MVSWDKAIMAAFKVTAYSIMWGIIGLSIMFIGLSLMGLSLISNPMEFITKGVTMGGVALIGIILMVLGYIIIICGSLASFMKVLVELILEEIY